MGTMSRYALVCVLTLVSVGLGADPLPTTREVRTENGYVQFQKALSAEDEPTAQRLGDGLFEELSGKYAGEEGFRTLKSKLLASEFLANQMVSQLRKATQGRIVNAGSDILERRQAKPIMVAPAKEFYETAVKVFGIPIRIQNLPVEEREFLAKYYDFQLRGMTTKIGKAGLALAVADAGFKGTHDYVLVLPLLHAQGDRGVNVSILPKWLRQAEELNSLSDSCLLHFGLPFQAMAVARYACESQKKPFSEREFYETAAGKCAGSSASTAVECLNRALVSVPADKIDDRVKLQFRIYQVWWDAGNYALAASQAKKIATEFPAHAETGRAIQSYYTSLANSGNADAVLTDIDTALGKKAAQSYRAQLLFVKWWALRKKRDKPANLAVLEKTMVSQYGDNPIVAPILFSQAMDSLANQDYQQANELLAAIAEKFPQTKSAEQAKRIMSRLAGIKRAG